MGPTATSRRALLERLSADCEESGVDWVLLWGRSGLGASGHDVDLLVRPEHLLAFEEVVLAAGGVPLPRRLPAWHRLYRLGPLGPNEVLLDVVTELRYGPDATASGLEHGVLDRRVPADLVPDPGTADAFWTTLLHCLLDKDEISDRRWAELVDAVASLERPSPGERWAATALPGLTADAAVDAVRSGDREALRSRLRRSAPPTAPARIGRGLRRWGAPRLWKGYAAARRSTGLAARPRAVDVLENVGVQAVVRDVRRRPGLLDLSVLVRNEDIGRARTALEDARFVSRWLRFSREGASLARFRAGNVPGRPHDGRSVVVWRGIVRVQRVMLIGIGSDGEADHFARDTFGVVWAESLVMPGRMHCRWVGRA